MARVFPKQGRVALSGGFADAFPRGPYRAEGGHVRAVLAPEHDEVGVRLVQVVVERGEEERLLFLFRTTHRL
jgi:hypothetical protein